MRVKFLVPPLMLICCAASFSQDAGLGHIGGLAPTPPMGWNSWNHFGDHVTDAYVRAAADALVTNGMRDAGYV